MYDFYRKKPIEVQAMEFTGNIGDLQDFVGTWNWGRADAKDVYWDHQDEEQVVVWNEIEKTWVPTPIGWWVIRGVKGEFYSCRPDVFEATYEISC